MSRLKLFVCLATSLCSLALAAPAQADFAVDDESDPAVIAPDGTCDAPGGDTCTLREAISEANNTPALDTITFIPILPAINLVLPLTITQPIVIDGNGSGTMIQDTVIQGNDTFRLLSISVAGTPVITLQDMRLQDGGVVNPNSDAGGGAGIRTDESLTLTNVAVVNNQLTGTGNGSGAGVFATTSGTTLTLTNSTVSDNTINLTTNAGVGGGISVAGDLVLTNSTVSDNSAVSPSQPNGAGIQAGGAFSILGSTISDNGLGVGGLGGGLNDVGNPGLRTITNSTISGNSGLAAGGLRLASTTSITNTTFDSNTTTGNNGNDIAALIGGTTVTVKNTILGSASPACSTDGAATIVSAVPGHNIDAGMSCGFGTTNGNQQSTNPLLAGINANGGPTETHALMPGSPAIDTGAPTGLATDQRGIPRPQGTLCDIGAFELEAPNDAPSCAGFPAIVPPLVTPLPATPTTPAPTKRCKKGQKLKKGKCVKKKRKKK